MQANRTVVGVDTAKRVFQLHWVEMETGEMVDLRLTRAKFLEHFANRSDPFSPLARLGVGGVFHAVYHVVSHPSPSPSGVAPVRNHPCWKAQTPADERRDDAACRRVLANRRRDVVRVALAGSVPRR